MPKHLPLQLHCRGLSPSEQEQLARPHPQDSSRVNGNGAGSVEACAALVEAGEVRLQSHRGHRCRQPRHGRQQESLSLLPLLQTIQPAHGTLLTDQEPARGRPGPWSRQEPRARGSGSRGRSSAAGATDAQSQAQTLASATALDERGGSVRARRTGRPGKASRQVQQLWRYMILCVWRWIPRRSAADDLELDCRHWQQP